MGRAVFPKFARSVLFLFRVLCLVSGQRFGREAGESSWTVASPGGELATRLSRFVAFISWTLCLSHYVLLPMSSNPLGFPDAFVASSFNGVLFTSNR